MINKNDSFFLCIKIYKYLKVILDIIIIALDFNINVITDLYLLVNLNTIFLI